MWLFCLVFVCVYIKGSSFCNMDISCDSLSTKYVCRDNLFYVSLEQLYICRMYISNLKG